MSLSPENLHCNVRDFDLLLRTLYDHQILTRMKSTTRISEIGISSEKLLLEYSTARPATIRIEQYQWGPRSQAHGGARLTPMRLSITTSQSHAAVVGNINIGVITHSALINMCKDHEVWLGEKMKIKSGNA